MDILIPIIELSRKRKIFHSEADFQFALAWEIQNTYPNANVRLEYCPEDMEPVMHIDILVVIDDEWFPIELKYKTLRCVKTSNGEVFKLKNHGAQDLGRYDFLKDVRRIEQLRKELPKFKKGYSVLLTNDPSYWGNCEKKNTVYYEFSLCEGTEKMGVMKWAEHAGRGTIKGRETPIALDSNYLIHWQKYSEFDNARTGEFRYTILSCE